MGVPPSFFGIAAEWKSIRLPVAVDGSGVV